MIAKLKIKDFLVFIMLILYVLLLYIIPWYTGLINLDYKSINKNISEKMNEPVNILKIVNEQDLKFVLYKKSNKNVYLACYKLDSILKDKGNLIEYSGNSNPPKNYTSSYFHFSKIENEYDKKTYNFAIIYGENLDGKVKSLTLSNSDRNNDTTNETIYKRDISKDVYFIKIIKVDYEDVVSTHISFWDKNNNIIELDS